MAGRALLLLAVLCGALLGGGTCLRVKGSFGEDDFFVFLAKFGFQRTDAHSQRDSFGYIYGNATGEGIAQASGSGKVTLAVLDRALFLQFYQDRKTSSSDRAEACRRMFSRIGPLAYSASCAPSGQDYLRAVPCKRAALCPDEDSPSNVIPGSQFTYVVQNLQPRFWYVSMVACYRNETTCEWQYRGDSKEKIHYDFWVVNGNPNLSASSVLSHQFSFDRQNAAELYLVFWMCYVILVPFQIYAVRSQRHPVTKLFTVSLMMEFAALCSIVVHTVKFAFDGVGFRDLQIAGDILDILSRAMFMLLLLLLAKGWAVTRMELTRKPIVFGVWLCYGVVHILLYVWNMTEVDIIEEIDEYQTWPGWLILSLRVSIMIWFIYELRNTMLYEHNMVKLNFFLHFGASSLVWFVYLPVIALIALQIGPLWRFKFLLGITYSADCMAFCVMAHLLWPTRSEQYLLLTSANYTGMEELDEFNEAPHVVHNSESADGPARHHPFGRSRPTDEPDDGENLILDNAEDDEVIFTAIPDRSPNSHLKNDVYS